MSNTEPKLKQDKHSWPTSPKKERYANPLKIYSTKSKKLRTRRTIEQKTTAQLVKVADEYFSKYVRLRDSECTEEGFIGTCITCTKTGLVATIEGRFVKGWNAGHFVTRGNKVVRFADENVNLQCAFRCNNMRSGEIVKYRVALQNKYGAHIPRMLEKLAETTNYYKFTKPELLQIIADSKQYIQEYLNYADNSTNLIPK